MENHPPGDKSKKYLEWQVSHFKNLLKEETENWSKYIDRLTTENHTLKQTLAATKKEADTLKQELDKCQACNEKLKSELDNSVADLRETRVYYTNLEEELVEKIENIRQEKDTQLRLQEEAYMRELDQLNEQTNQVRERLQMEFNNESEKMRNKEKERMERLIKAEGELKDQVKINEQLKKEAAVAKMVPKLEATVKTNERVIETQVMELVSLRKQNETAQQNLDFVKQSNKELKASFNNLNKQIKCQEDELNDQSVKLLRSTFEHEEVDELCCKLLETVRMLKKRIHNDESEIKKLEATVSSLKTQELRFKEDLQICASYVSDHRELAQKLISLTEKYIRGNEKIELDKESWTGFHNMQKWLIKRNEIFDRIEENNKNQVKHMQKHMEYLHQPEAAAIRQANEEFLKRLTLEKELKKTKLQLQKAEQKLQQVDLQVQQAVPKKAKSVLKKKIFKRAQVAPLIEKEPSSLYAQDMSAKEGLYDMFSVKHLRNESITNQEGLTGLKQTKQQLKKERKPVLQRAVSFIQKKFSKSAPAALQTAAKPPSLCPEDKSATEDLSNILSIKQLKAPSAEDGLPPVDI